MNKKIEALYLFVPVIEICKIILEDSINLKPELDDKNLLIDTIKKNIKLFTNRSTINNKDKEDFIINESNNFNYDMKDELTLYKIELNTIKDNSTFNYNCFDTDILFQIVLLKKLDRHMIELQGMYDKNKVKELNLHLDDFFKDETQHHWKIFKIDLLNKIIIDNDFFMLSKINKQRVMRTIYYKIANEEYNNEKVWEQFISEYFEMVHYLPIKEVLLFLLNNENS